MAKAEKKLNDLDFVLKSIANLTNNKRLYDRVTNLITQLWMGNDLGIKDISQFQALIQYNWLKNQKRKAVKQGLTLVKK
tara:strand:- start:365 stop:601 length:237 start_codon:yes stop_codon:yes gene_type:complete